jgi:hypothetical protein
LNSNIAAFIEVLTTFSNVDTNIISHAAPAEGTCHEVNVNTAALYLVTGDGAAGAYF